MSPVPRLYHRTLLAAQAQASSRSRPHLRTLHPRHTKSTTLASQGLTIATWPPCRYPHACLLQFDFTFFFFTDASVLILVPIFSNSITPTNRLHRLRTSSNTVHPALFTSNTRLHHLLLATPRATTLRHPTLAATRPTPHKNRCRTDTSPIRTATQAPRADTRPPLQVSRVSTITNTPALAPQKNKSPPVN